MPDDFDLAAIPGHAESPEARWTSVIFTTLTAPSPRPRRPPTSEQEGSTPCPEAQEHNPGLRVLLQGFPV